ncbi:helix-turn-helix transcriptional regulator [uncultured Clostridium sp.]|uniref:helix-turn-helix domain-containing protein n=1 Tax=uncultured Clostridium sp. TaxID=59620 RepID=UPI0032167DB5
MKNNIGLKIKTSRKGAKLTQNDLSCDILDRSTLSKIENGYIYPSIPQLMHISKILNISMSDLLCEDTSPCDVSISSISKNLNELYANKEYNKIIDTINPYDFITTYYVGLSYYKLNLREESKALLEKCEGLFYLLRDDLKPVYAENLSIAITTLGRLVINSFSDVENYNYLIKGLNYLDVYNLKNVKTYFIIINNIGVYYLYIYKYEKAINFYVTFLKNNLDSLPTTVLALIHSNLNIAYFSIKNYDKAIEHVKKAIFFFYYIGNIFECGKCYINLFNAYLYKNETNKAYDTINEVFDKFEDIKIINIFKICELVLLYNTNKINQIIVKKKSINYGTLRESSKIDYDFIMGYVYFKQNKYKSAIKHFNKCINSLIERKRYLDVSIAYDALYFMDEKEDFKEKFLEYKKLHENDKYNHISTNITTPSYFLHNKEK